MMFMVAATAACGGRTGCFAAEIGQQMPQISVGPVRA
jgi:hypothetical protein